MKRFKFIYFSHQTLKIPRVATQCIVSLCEAAAQIGANTEIISLNSKIHSSEPKYLSFEELYGIDFPIAHKAYPILNFNGDKLSFLKDIQRLFVYTVHTFRFIFSEKTKQYKYVIFSARNYAILAMLALVKRILRKEFIILADVHGMPKSSFASWVHKIVDGNVCISKSLADALMHKLNLPSEKLCVAHSGVKIKRFISRSESKEELRTRLNLPRNKNIICYTGKVYYRYEEISYYLQVAEKLNEDTVIVIVGGRPDQVSMWRKECAERNISNIIFCSFVLPSEIPDYLRAADLLLMYYSPSPLNEYRSPGKLFEYLASGVPVVASRTQSIEEIVSDGENVFLVEPYQPRLLIKKINEILTSGELLEYDGRNGRECVKEFTWRKRAQCFLDFGMFLADKQYF